MRRDLRVGVSFFITFLCLAYFQASWVHKQGFGGVPLTFLMFVLFISLNLLMVCLVRRVVIVVMVPVAFWILVAYLDAAASNATLITTLEYAVKLCLANLILVGGATIAKRYVLKHESAASP